MSESARRQITEDEIKRFERDGVVCLRGILDPEWVREIGACIDEDRAKNGTKVMKLHDEVRVPALARNWMALDDERFRAVSWESALPEIASALMRSASVNIYFDSYLIKRPGCEVESPWHHDLPYYPF
jgi:Phytanoyl-CoA dioxygenase (PhyH)